MLGGVAPLPNDEAQRAASQRKKSTISIAHIEKSTMLGKALHDADTNKNGELSLEELALVLGNAENRVAYAKSMTYFTWALIAMLCAIIASVFGLSFAVAHLTKDTMVSSNTLLSKNSNQPVQVL
jgi:hypothetical protein